MAEEKDPLHEFAQLCIKIILETGYMKEVLNSMDHLDKIGEHHLKRIYGLEE